MVQQAEILYNLASALEAVLPGARASLKRSSAAPSGTEGIALVRFEGQRFRVLVEVSTRCSSGSLQQAAERLTSRLEHCGGDSIGLIVAPYLGPRHREQLRGLGVNFLDLCGNAWIRHGGIHVDRQGFANRFSEQRVGRDPFADKASLILRELLRDPGRGWGVRELASELRLDPGFVSRMGRELEGLGYAAREAGRLKLRDARSVLDDWAHAYNYRRNRMRGYYRQVKEPLELLAGLRVARVSEEAVYALSLQAGAHLMDPHARFSEVHVYVQDEITEQALRDALGLVQVDEGADVWLMSPYYRRSVFDGLREVDGLPVVSDVQLYLDLHSYPLRGAEQAEHLYASVIEPTLPAEMR